MNPSELFEQWAPPASIWSLWAKPVLFAEMDSASIRPPFDQTLPKIDVGHDANTGIIVDLPVPNR